MLLRAVLAGVMGVGLVALLGGLMVLVPPPGVAGVVAGYWADPWGSAPWQQGLGVVAVLTLMWWPLPVGLLLLGGMLYFWVRSGGGSAVAPYVAHIHAVETALEKSRTQLQLAEDEWHGFAQKLDELFSNAGECWLVLDGNGAVRRFNSAALTQAKRVNSALTTLEGVPATQIIEAPQLVQALREARSDKKVWKGEVELPALRQTLLIWVLPFGEGMAVVARDITHQQAGDADLADAGLLLRQLVEDSPRPFAILSPELTYLYISHSWLEVLGLDRRQNLHGQEHWAVLPSFPSDRAMVMEHVKTGQALRQDNERVTRDGQEKVLSWHLRPWRKASGALGGYIFGVTDMTELSRLRQQVAQAEDRENQLAYADALTGLPNRQLFLDRLNVALAQAYRHLGKVAVLFLDLDGFKGVNDQLGHAAGDLLLKLVAERLKNTIRTSDTLARLGGDEFTMILNIREARDAEVVATKVLNAIRQPYTLNGVEVTTVGTSIGVALYPYHGTQASDLIKAADNAMYAAKAAGKNTFRVADGAAKPAAGRGAEPPGGGQGPAAHEAAAPANPNSAAVTPQS